MSAFQQNFYKGTAASKAVGDGDFNGIWEDVWNDNPVGGYDYYEEGVINSAHYMTFPLHVGKRVLLTLSNMHDALDQMHGPVIAAIANSLPISVKITVVDLEGNVTGFFKQHTNITWTAAGGEPLHIPLGNISAFLVEIDPSAPEGSVCGISVNAGWFQ
jgi:hypothetical protein